tara:strand:- start:258 stop:953 length:696 start_codon:yes stop_codon:yes gene_type:complete
MIKNFSIIFFTCIVLFTMQSCDNENGWDFEMPGCIDISALNYDSNATFDNGSCIYYMPSEIFNQLIDASSYNDWIYFSFELDSILIINHPEESLDWDIAFKRNHMKTNGGLSGQGSSCAIVDTSKSWSDDSLMMINEIPNFECQFDSIIEGDIFTYQGCYNNSTHLFEDCVKNPALDNWGEFNDSYYFEVNNYQLFVKLANSDNYVKLWPKNYYDSNNESARISLSYQLLN